ncbi:MAG: hypothetical protein Q7I97_09340 [Thermovirgaceae bacterium]|nr:hypothetical protein [Thermovirgaceae bacterium]
MLIALGDLRKGNCTFSFDEKGQMKISFPDHSAILDGKDGIQVFGTESLGQKSEAERWLEDFYSNS